MPMNKTIAKIVDMLKSAKTSGQPAIMLVGAGASKTAGIPTAAEMIKELRELYPSIAQAVKPGDPNEYGAVMNGISPAERRSYILRKLAPVRVNWAHVGIAQLIENGYVDTVLTTNFDNLVARACAVGNKFPAIYDFSTSVAVAHDRLVKPAVIHLHGQGHGFVLLNSAEETRRHAGKIAPLIKDSVDSRHIVVLGYSGGSDSVFLNIRRGFRDNQRIFWISRSLKPNTEVEAFVSKHNYAEFVGGQDADDFMVRLCIALGIWPPPLLSNPEGLMVARLREFTPYPSHIEADAYDATADLINRLSAADRTNRARQIDYDRMRSLLLKRKYAPLIRWALGNIKSVKSNRDLLPIALRACLERGNLNYIAGRKSVAKAQKIHNFKVAIRHYQVAFKFDKQYTPCLYNIGSSIQQQAYLSEAATSQVSKFKMAIEWYDKVLDCEPRHARALVNKANALNAIARRVRTGSAKRDYYGAAIALYKEAIDADSNFEQGYHNLGKIYLELSDANFLRSSGKKNLLGLAKKALLRSEAVKKGSASYNLACLHARIGDFRAVERYLRLALAEGYLPIRAHLEKDTDMDPVRGTRWFKELLAKAPLSDTIFWGL